jgi:hypothetical protein
MPFPGLAPWASLHRAFGAFYCVISNFGIGQLSAPSLQWLILNLPDALGFAALHPGLCSRALSGLQLLDSFGETS